MICKACKRSFHYCSSCDSDAFADVGYCGKECFETSEEYKEMIGRIEGFLVSLSEEQMIQFKYLYEEIIEISQLWNSYFHKILKEK